MSGSAPGFPSETYNYGTPPKGPAIMELLLEAYERCGKVGIELTSQYLLSGRRSLNLVLSSWANRGPNLWTVGLFTQFMPQGIGEYVCSPQIVDIFPDSVLLRQTRVGAPVSVPPNFITIAGSTEVVVFDLPATPAPGQYINIGVMVSVGGTVLDGYYKVEAVQESGQALINAATPATVSTGGSLWSIALWGQGLWASGTGGGGVVPQFTTTAGSNQITVNFPSHGFAAGQPFNVEVPVNVGGITLNGTYTVAWSADTDQFTIYAVSPALFADSQFENDGDTLLSTQATNQGLNLASNPVDIVLYPLSRGDWMAIPNKRQQGRPTSFWIDRQISPVIHVWPVPDQNGPYEMRYRASRQVMDADIVGGQALGVPFRMLETFTADLAAHLATKWAPERIMALKAYATEQWVLASTEDRERVSTFIGGDLSQYFD
jgi:hypothetical protein